MGTRDALFSLVTDDEAFDWLKENKLGLLSDAIRALTSPDETEMPRGELTLADIATALKADPKIKM